MARTNRKVAISKTKNIMPKEEEIIHADDEASSTSTSSSEAAAAEDYFVEEDLDDASEDSGSEEGVDNDDDDDDAMMEPSDADDNEDVDASTTSSSSSSSDDEDESGDEEGENTAAVDDDHISSQGISNTEQCTFDLTNLLAFNTHQINAAELYQKQQQKHQQQQLNQEWYSSSPTIAIATTTSSSNLFVNESLLLAKAAEGTTQLLRELWKLPKEKTDVGLLAKLPLSSSSSSETKLPRSLVRRVCHVHYFSSMFIQFLSLPIINTYHSHPPLPKKLPSGKNLHSNAELHPNRNAHARYTTNPLGNGNISPDRCRIRPTPDRNLGQSLRLRRMRIPCKIHGKNYGRRRRVESIRMWSRG
jgi:hypothetical protein